MIRPVRSLLLIALLACGALAQTLRAPLSTLDETVARGMREFEVPGLAIAVVKDGEVVLSRGYGVRRLGDPAPVDDQTLFGIASNTKAFTAAVVAMLVDQGKAKWDDRVIDHLPAFQLADPYATREMTLRDALCHRSGLPAYGADMLGFSYDRPRADILRRLRYLKPASSFRARYAYQNNMFVVAGEAAAAIAGQSWEDLVEQRIFAPLGMSASSTRFAALQKQPNRISAHARVDGQLRPVDWQKVEVIGPAASINSSVRDLSRWMLAQLNQGAYPGGRLFSEAASREMWTPQMALRSNPRGKLPKPMFSAYGLGWSLAEYRGRKLVSHGGALTGMFSRTVLVPQEKLGVVILTNAETVLQTALSYHVLDAFLGGAAEDWIAVYGDDARAEQKRAAARLARQEAERNRNSRPSLELAAYAGRYDCPLMGQARIETSGARLRVVLDPAPAGTGEAEHWQYDTFVVRWKDPTVVRAFLTFQIGPDGKVQGFRMAQFEEADPSFDFENYEFTALRPQAPGR